MKHEHRTYQVHANANVDHGDVALRLTITFYDEAGFREHHQTWTRHVRDLWFEGSDWQALFIAVELARMMGDISKAGLQLDALDVPLF